LQGSTDLPTKIGAITDETTVDAMMRDAIAAALKK
jgi:hypothetical protein